jgi:hypothetical protein
MRIFVSALVVVCTLAGPPAAEAQRALFGVRGGLSIADIAVSGTEGFEATAGSGPVVGAVGGLRMTARARLQVELLWASRRFSATAGGFDAEISSSGVEIPVLFVLNGAPDRRVVPLIYVGPQLNVITKVTQTVAGNDIDMSDSIRNGDPGITFGGGLEIAAPRGAFTIDARANIGFRNLNEDPVPSFKSRAFQLLAGYRF